MDFEKMAQEYMATIYQMRQQNSQKQINDTMYGENFVLFFINEHPDKVIPSDISHALGITSARVAAALKSLERKDLIVRKIDPDDRRRILIEITKQGQEQVRQQRQQITDMTVNMLQYLGEDDAGELVRIMKKLAKRKR